ncbi:MAG: hypothetical protein WCF66_22525 [Pseudolabrys sp.]
MKRPPSSLIRFQIRRQVFLLATAGLLLSGCANSDFGEVNDVLVTNGIHDWIGRPAKGKPSKFEYTDDERALRDTAFPLIEPPFDRQTWYQVAGEYGMIRYNLSDYIRYFQRLKEECHNSMTALYARLTDDIRNDTTRLSQFFETAGRVIDIDQKRQKSLAYISGLSKGEEVNAIRRIRENEHVVAIVRISLANRVASYRFALERLVITTPSTQAVDVERLLNQLQAQIGRYNVLPPTWRREPSLASSN